MAQLDEPKLTVAFEDDDRTYVSQIKSYSIDSDYLTPTDGWEFVVYAPDDPAALRRTFRPWRPVKLFLGDALQVLGRIDSIQSDGPTALKVTGRDYLADVCDGGADPSTKFKKEQDIGDAILSIVKPFGITTIGNLGFNLTRNILTGQRAVFDKAPPREFKSAKLEEFKASDNEGAFELANKIAARHGYTLQPAMRRDWILLCEPEYRQAPLFKLRRPGNVLEASCVRDWSKVPTVTIARGRQTGNADTIGGIHKEMPTFTDGASPDLAKLDEVTRVIENGIISIREKRFDPKKGDTQTYGYDPPVYRPMFYKDDDSRNLAQLERGVRRMVAERLRGTLQYTARLRGHTDPATDAIYAIDCMADVQDGIEDIEENLWIQSRKFWNDGSSGPMTELRMIRPGSYIL